MDMDPDDLDSWRIFFRTSGFNIFVIIHKAIMVAAKDHPHHLKLRKDQIVYLLYQHCYPCNQAELSIPLEETNIFQLNADRNNPHCKNHHQEDGYQDKNRSVDHVDMRFINESNGEKKIAGPSNVVDGNNKETTAVNDEDRYQRVEHQDQILPLNTVVEQSGDSKDLNSDGVSTSKYSTFLESLNKSTIGDIQGVLNKSTNVEGGNDSKILNTNKILDGKDDVLEEGLNKTVNHNDGSKKLSFNCTLHVKHGDFHDGLNKTVSENSHYIVDGGEHLSQIDGSSFELAGALKDLINEGDETSKQVFEIKKILENGQDKSVLILMELLMKLKRMDLNLKILEATLIGKAVSPLRKHNVREIRKVAHSLIRDWRSKVDEWLSVKAAATQEFHSLAEDQLPSCPLNEGATIPLATAAELEKIFEGEDVEEFFSILPPENMIENLYIPEELGFAEEQQVPINTNTGRNDMSERISEKDVQQSPLQLQGTSSPQENCQPPSNKNELERFNKIKRVREKDSTMKLDSHRPSLRTPKRNGDKKDNAIDNASDNAFAKQRDSSTLRRHNLQKLKQLPGKQGKCIQESSAMKLSLASTSRLRPEEPRRDKHSAKFQQGMEKSSCSRQLLSKKNDKVKIYQSDELQGVEERRRKRRERYEKEHAKKQHANRVLDVNHYHSNQGHKRHKHHHARSGL